MKQNTLSISIGLLLEYSTVRQLQSNSDMHFDTPRKQTAGRVQVSNIQYIPAVGNGILTVKAESKGEKQAYNTTIQFNGVEFTDGNNPYSVALNGTDNIHVVPVQSATANVQVHCTCLDFYWRFAVYNNKHQSLLGKPPAPYVKKTDRAPNNPDKVPGICKHIMKLTNQLRAEKVLR